MIISNKTHISILACGNAVCQAIPPMDIFAGKNFNYELSDSLPLDTSIFGPLKSYWSQPCRDYMFANPVHIVTKFQFSSLFRQVWSKGMSVDNICGGFRKTVFFSFSPEAILKDRMESNSSVNESEMESTSGSSSST